MGELVHLSQRAPLIKRPVLEYWPGRIVDEVYEKQRKILASYRAQVWMVAPFLDISEKDLKCLKQKGPCGRKTWFAPIDLIRVPRTYTRMKTPPLLHVEGLMPFGEVELPWRKT
jgi:hypothetical protein